MWILTALFLLLILCLLIEAGSYLVLNLKNENRAKEITRRHPIFGGIHRDGGQHLMPNESVDHRGSHKRRDPTPSHPLYGWRYTRPSIYWDLQTDKDGFLPNRTGESSAIDPDAKWRIFITGGSTVAGTGASSNETTLPAALERILVERTGERYNVVNAGCGAWYSQNQVAFLTQELFAFHSPDVVIVMDGYNDTWRAALSAQRFANAGGGRWTTEADFLYDPRLKSDLRTWTAIQKPKGALKQFIRAVGLDRTLRPHNYYSGALLLEGDSEPAETYEQEIDEDQIRRPPLNVSPYLANVRTSVATAVGWKTPILYILQPSIAYKETLTPEELKPLDKVRRETFFLGRWEDYGVPAGCHFDDIQRRFFEAARPGFLDLATEFDRESVRLLDLSKLFAESEEDLFYDYCHYTDRANELIAQEIAEPLLSLPLGSR